LAILDLFGINPEIEATGIEAIVVIEGKWHTVPRFFEGQILKGGTF
jgi:hypothetical protein